MLDLFDKISESTAYIKQQWDQTPKAGKGPVGLWNPQRLASHGDGRPFAHV